MCLLFWLLPQNSYMHACSHTHAHQTHRRTQMYSQLNAQKFPCINVQHTCTGNTVYLRRLHLNWEKRCKWKTRWKKNIALISRMSLSWSTPSLCLSACLWCAKCATPPLSVFLPFSVSSISVILKRCWWIQKGTGKKLYFAEPSGTSRVIRFVSFILLIYLQKGN